jgi:cytochrome c biogenesis protein CcdA/thiol-disulfide isomerase/thioredoxin
MTIILLFAFLTQIPDLTVHFFYSPDCGHCMDILLETIPKLQNKYEFKFKEYDIDILENYELLEKMEEGVEDIGEDLPIIFIGDSVFYGPDEVREKLDETIKGYFEDSPPVVEDTVKMHNDSLNPEQGEINLYYFYQPGCRECNRSDILLNALQQHYANLIVHKYDIFEDTDKVFYEALAEYMGVPESRRLIVPAVFVGNDYLIKDEITSNKITFLIKKNISGSSKLDSLNLTSAEDRILKRFSQFSILGILFAGLLDGINPCAFATLVFFVSYLLFIGRRRRDVVLMAIFFIAAVFIVYLAIGFGAYNLIKYLSGFNIIGKIIFLGFGIIAIILGILSLRDYFLAKKGDTDKMILQLPLSIKQRIHKDIKEKSAVGGIILGSLLAGFLISFLEFGCTGQIYLPTITFMTSKGGFALKPIFALLTYNIMFITPLIVIAILATIFTTKNIAKSLEKRIPTVKFFTALLFFALGIILILLA